LSLLCNLGVPCGYRRCESIPSAFIGVHRRLKSPFVEIGFFFWPYDPSLVQRMAAAAEQYGYDMIGIADAPGNAMDPWVAATMVAQATARSSISASRPRNSASR